MIAALLARLDLPPVPPTLAFKGRFMQTRREGRMHRHLVGERERSFAEQETRWDLSPSATQKLVLDAWVRRMHSATNRFVRKKGWTQIAFVGLAAGLLAGLLFFMGLPPPE